jgi:hypothetical protein
VTGVFTLIATVALMAIMDFVLLGVTALALVLGAGQVRAVALSTTATREPADVAVNR